MKRIENPPPPKLAPGSPPEAIANLHEALHFLLGRGLIPLPEGLRDQFEEQFHEELREKRYGSATAGLVASARIRLGLEPGEIVDERTASALNALLLEAGAFGADPPQWVVRGQVVDESAPLNDVAVSLFDRDLFFRRDDEGRGQHLGTETTREVEGKAGWFEISYSTRTFAAGDSVPGKGPVPDLIFSLSRDGRPLEEFRIVRVADGTALSADAQVSADDMLMGLEPRSSEEVRIILEGGRRAAASEYERLIDALAALLPDGHDEAAFERREAMVLAMLPRLDEKEHRDISFAAREIGVERLLIERLVAAAALAHGPFEGQFPVFLFYGLGRVGAGTDLRTLALASEDSLRSGLERASGGPAPVIAAFSPEGRLAELARDLHRDIARRVTDLGHGEGAATLADLVGAELPDKDQQALLWSRFTAREGDVAKYWSDLESEPGFDETKVRKLKYGFEIGAVARGNLGLVNALKHKHPGAASVRDLAFELDSADKWRSLIEDEHVDIPGDIPGEGDERTANYAASLAASVQAAHPAAAVAAAVGPLPAGTLGGLEEAVAGFVRTAARDHGFDLVRGRIGELLSRHGDELLEGVDAVDRPKVIAEARRVQRLFRLSTGPKSLQALLEAGFGSAREIAELPDAAALDRLVPIVGEAEARIIINRARNISASAIHQYVFVHDALDTTGRGGAL